MLSKANHAFNSNHMDNGRPLSSLEKRGGCSNYRLFAGDCDSLVDQIAWSVVSDLDVICLVESSSSGPATKKLMTVADAVCGITRSHGATEASMVDHDMIPKTKDGVSKVVYPKMVNNMHFRTFQSALRNAFAHHIPSLTTWPGCGG